MRRPRPRRCAAWTRLSTTAAARCSTAATPRCFPGFYLPLYEADCQGLGEYDLDDGVV